jgi:hypothetical protein
LVENAKKSSDATGVKAIRPRYTFWKIFNKTYREEINNFPEEIIRQRFLSLTNEY